MKDDELHKRDISRILQHCISQNQGKAVLLDVDAGVCGHHAAPRLMVGKFFQFLLADANILFIDVKGVSFMPDKSILHWRS